MIKAILPSLAQLQPNPNWAKLPLFNRKGWKTVRFGDVVRMLKEQVDPVAEGVERYVAGEHIKTENVHIRKWGLVGDGYLGPAFIRRFRKGQVLYGSRRTYLKKVAVADWDGVTANTTFVLEAVEGKLLQELLPWLMLSERFTKHSIQESKGSTNPYINFPDIAKFEFALPPIEQQRRIVEILRAVDETMCAWEASSHNIRILYHSRLKAEFESLQGRWPTKALGDVARVERGAFSHRPRNLPAFYGGKYPFVQTGDVQNADRLLRRFEYYLTELGTTYSKSFPAGTIFVTIAAVIGATAISAREVFVTDSVVGIVPYENMNVDYVELFLRYKRHFLEKQAATQTAQKNINLQVLRPLLIPCPPRAVQERIASEILEPFHTTKEVEFHLEKTRSLLNSLANQVVEKTP